MRLVTAVTFLLCIFLLSSDSPGQTTRPAPAAFASLVEQLAQGLVSGDAYPINRSLENAGAISDFEGNPHASAEKLLTAGSGALVVTARAYGQTPSSLASDLATDFQNADVPETVRQQMIPGSDSIVRANVTAAEWIIQTLDPQKHHSIGVIVLCARSAPTPLNMRPRPVKPVFVLIKGEASGGKQRVAQLVFGNPLSPQE